MADATHRLDEFEIHEVSAVDRAANGEKFVVMKRDDSTDGAEATDGEKAEWTTAQINELPDDAFLYIEDGGEKDEDGMTVPRSLRHFPVRGPDGEIDLPHLRNALSRIPQADIPQDAKDAATERARRMLEDATEETEEAEDSEKAKPASDPAEPDKEKAEPEGEPADQAGGDGDSGAEAAEDPEQAKEATLHEGLLNEQAEALRMTVDRVIEAATGTGDFKMAMEYMDTAFSLLWSMRDSATTVRLMKEAGVDPFMDIERGILDKKAELITEAQKKAAEPVQTEKSADPLAGMEQRFAALESKIDKMAEALAKSAVSKALVNLHERVTKMEHLPAAPTTGASLGDGRADARKRAQDVDWPADLNAAGDE